MYLETEKIEELFQNIEQFQTIIIHRHQRPDPDAIGSQLGLKYLIKNQFPEKEVLAAGSTTKGLSWLGEMDSVTASNYQNALVIVTDTANQERIDGSHFEKGKVLIKIDHHPEVELYGDIQIVHTKASSCSEIIVAISDYLSERLPLNQKAAQLLYAGIVGDTGRFLFSSTTDYTFMMTAKLLQQGIDAFAINDHFQVMTLEEVKLQGFGYDHLVVNEAGVAYLKITQNDLKVYGVSEEQTNSLVNLASRIEGVLCWVTFVEQENESLYYRCRIRSKGPIINDIASRHGGGGHPMASGANAYSEDEINQIIEEMTQAAIAYKAK